MKRFLINACLLSAPLVPRPLGRFLLTVALWIGRR